MYRQPAFAPSVDTLLPFLRLAVGGAGGAELRFAPDLTPKQWQGLAAFAQLVPNEHPLALLDTTVMQSGKAGALVTTMALHLDAPRLRIPLEHLSWEPAFPAGFDASGVLHTPQGPVHLVRLPSRELSAALARLLSALAWWVRRGGGFALGAGAAAGPVGALAAQWLRGEGLAPSPVIAAQSLHVAGACLPDWIAPDSDEELLALVDETLSHDGTRALALTDRRLLSNNAAPLNIPYGAIQSVEMVKGLINSALRLVVAGQRVELTTTAPHETAQAIGGFLHHLLQLPPEHRRAAPAAPAAPDDPTGALAALRVLAWPDPRVSLLHELVHAAHTRGDIPLDAARDLVVRARLLHQALRQGHARHGGASASPLSVRDLDYLLWQSLGQPVRQQPVAGGKAMEFVLGGGGGGGRMIASSVVGLAMLAVVGVGWVGGGGGGSKTVRVHIAETRGGSYFTLTDDSGRGLAAPEPKLYASLSGALADAAAETLLRRVLLGWNVPSDALHAAPVEALDQGVTALLGRGDAGPFVRRDGLTAPPR
jgi:hypothetical protein